MKEINISGVANTQIIQHQKNISSKDNHAGFGAILNEAVNKITDIHLQTENAIKELSEGGDITNAIISMEKADISFQVMIEVRNKLINAYEEIMRMQV